MKPRDPLQTCAVLMAVAALVTLLAGCQGRPLRAAAELGAPTPVSARPVPVAQFPPVALAPLPALSLELGAPERVPEDLLDRARRPPAPVLVPQPSDGPAAMIERARWGELRPAQADPITIELATWRQVIRVSRPLERRGAPR